MKRLKALLVLGLLTLAYTEQTRADGTETLGVPTIPIVSGSGIAVGGVGMVHQPAALNVVVPTGATIKQVILYWEGFMLDNATPDNTLRVSTGGVPVTVTGTLIGGPAFFFYRDAYASTFRADITSLGLVAAGTNTLMLDELAFTVANNGAGIVVIYDDGGDQLLIDARDGTDLAYFNFPEPRKSTIPQTFSFAPSNVDRVARLDLLFSSVAGSLSGSTPFRPTAIEITTGGRTRILDNLLDSFNGEEWDTMTISVTIPAGATNVTVQPFSRDDLATGFVPASFDWLAAFFSLDVTATLGDTVYWDVNDNGTQEPGEPGIPGVTVLLSCVGPDGSTTTASATTDSAGVYVFTGIAGGSTCTVTVDSSTVPADKEQGICPPVFTINVAGGGTYLDADFCYKSRPAAIGDLVFNDLNANGTQDGGAEVGVDGVTVELFNCVGDVLVGVTNTSGGGLYRFNVQPGDYYVKFSNLPAGFVFSPSTPGADSDANDSDANPADGKTDCTTLTLSEVDTTWDAGIYLPAQEARIGDFVFNDTNANGVQDAGEAGVDGVTVELFTCVGDVLTGTTNTAGGGIYNFTVPPGDYYVKFSNLPAGFVFSPSTFGGSDPNDSDPDPANGKTECTSLAAGENDSTWDAGIYRPGSIGDTVFVDLNDNGIQDPGEPGVVGALVMLSCIIPDGLAINLAATSDSSTTTDSEGHYIFTGVTPGSSCTLTVDPASIPNDKEQGRCPPTFMIVVGPGQAHLDADFCYRPKEGATASIGDSVYSDSNDNGIQEVGEPGIADVRVLLSCTASDGGVFGAAVMTDAAGKYLFVGIPAGSACTLTVDPATVPAGQEQGRCPPSFSVTVAGGQTYLDADFCYKANGGVGGIIGDLVYCDLNADGVQDADEPGIPGVKIKILCKDASGATIASADVTTDTNGLYRFIDVPAGACEVSVDRSTVPANCNVPVCPVIVRHELAPGEVFLLADFCFTPPPPLGRIGDIVYCDQNANGVQDAGDLGIPGVVLYLVCRNAAGRLIGSGIAETDGQGRYLFLDVPAGICDVWVDVSTAPSDCNTPVCPNRNTIHLGPGEIHLGADFCFTKPLFAIGTGAPSLLSKSPPPSPGPVPSINYQAPPPPPPTSGPLPTIDPTQ